MQQGEIVVELRPAILSSLEDIVSAGSMSLSDLINDLLQEYIDDRNDYRKAAETRSDTKTKYYSFEEAMDKLGLDLVTRSSSVRGPCVS